MKYGRNEFNRIAAAAALTLLILAAAVAAASAPLSILHRWDKQIRPGIYYTRFSMSVQGRPLQAYMLRISLDHPELHIQPILANNKLDSLETVPSMAKRTGAVVAINGSFFNRSEADPFPVGFLMINGRTLYFSHEHRSAFGMTKQKIPLFGYPKTKGIIYLEKTGEYFFLWGMNHRRSRDEALVFTPEYGWTSGTNAYGREVTVTEDRVTGMQYGNSRIPQDGFVLSLHGDSMKYFNWFQRGDRVRLYFVVDPAWLDVYNAITGGPMLIRGGKIVLNASAEEKLWQGCGARIPATAVGNTADGYLIFLVIDGRQKKCSIGVTYAELAEFMRSLGAINAIGMDGGGSATMAIDGNVVNKPSDGRPRRVSNAIGVFVGQ
jgi:hypothetical protein